MARREGESTQEAPCLDYWGHWEFSAEQYDKGEGNLDDSSKDWAGIKPS